MLPCPPTRRKASIACPDLRFLIELYQSEKSALQRAYIKWSLRDVMDIDNEACCAGVFVINGFFRNWGHRFIYDEATLRWALTEVGFRNTVQRELGQSEDEQLRGIENQTRILLEFLRLETMVLESTKP